AVRAAAGDVDQGALHVGIVEDDLEGRSDLRLGGATADVEEVGGLAAVQLDDVHGGHGQAGAVDEAGDVAVEADVVEAELTGGHLARILLGRVAHGDDVLLAVQRVVVEVELGVEGDHLVVAGDGQRIDFDERAVALQVEVPEREEELGRLGGELAAQAEVGGDLAGLVGLQAEGWADEFLEDLLRGLFGDLLN